MHWCNVDKYMHCTEIDARCNASIMTDFEGTSPVAGFVDGTSYVLK